MKNSDTTIAGGQFRFPETIWSVILQAKERDSKEYSERLNQLIRTYWQPVYRYIRILWCKSNEDAKDLTQEYFMTFLEKDYLQSVSKEKGLFRSYIKVTLKNFLMKSKRNSARQKRGGDAMVISIDNSHINPSDSRKSQDPADLFDIEWVRTVFRKSVESLKKVLKSEGKGIYLRVFETYYISAGGHRSYSDIANELGIKESDVRNYLSNCRIRLRQIMKKIISGYAIDKSHVEEELKYLLSVKEGSLKNFVP
ncbi:MAG: sigma-70 family RNA polymerase sigma factor [Planctomycetes bacterium]|nr:sigma-70 family RNA polymerase sigma factor [Planctomycetota bacterium]